MAPGTVHRRTCSGAPRKLAGAGGKRRPLRRLGHQPQRLDAYPRTLELVRRRALLPRDQYAGLRQPHDLAGRPGSPGATTGRRSSAYLQRSCCTGHDVIGPGHVPAGAQVDRRAGCGAGSRNNVRLSPGGFERASSPVHLRPVMDSMGVVLRIPAVARRAIQRRVAAGGGTCHADGWQLLQRTFWTHTSWPAAHALPAGGCCCWLRPLLPPCRPG